MAFEYLSQLGKAIDEVKLEADSILGKVAKEFAEEAVAKMQALVPKASDTLKNSIVPDFKHKEGGIIIQFLADDYWDFVNSGVEGTRQSAGSITNQFGSTYQFRTENPSPSMVEAFGGGANYGKNGEQGNMQNWMASRGIIAANGDYNSLAYAIAKSVKLEGIKPTPFVNETFDEQNITQFQNALLDAFESIL